MPGSARCVAGMGSGDEVEGALGRGPYFNASAVVTTNAFAKNVRDCLGTHIAHIALRAFKKPPRKTPLPAQRVAEFTGPPSTEAQHDN